MQSVSSLAFASKTPTAPQVQNIAAQIKAQGKAYRNSWPWIIVGETQKIQGWKLHISSTPSEINALLACILPILNHFEAPFKIVQDMETCAILNEGSLGATQIGKCMTIYADEIAQADALAEALVMATASFNGPDIISDLYLGGRVFTRYGGFNPVIERDTLGQVQSYIYMPDGTKQPDGYGDPAHYLTLAGIPFTKEKYALTLPAILPQHHVLNEKYLIVDALDHRPRGATFQAIDITTPNDIRPKMIKQGRFHTLSDELGRDIRNRFHHEMLMQQLVKEAHITPACHDYFEDEHSAYLVFDYLYGAQLENHMASLRQQQNWAALSREKQLHILDVLAKAAETVHLLHEAQVVHRDISVSNLYVCDDGKVLLIDLELSQFCGASERPFGKGTPGFMSPEQEHFAPATFAQDVYGFGAVMLYCLSGIDPRRFRLQETASHADIRALFPNLPESFYDCLFSCFSIAPELRPGITEIREEIAHAKEHISTTLPQAKSPASLWLKDKARRCWEDGLHGLETLCITRQDGLWLSAPISQNNRLASQVQQVELRRSLNRGVAGVCYLLGVMARHSPCLPERFPSLFSRAKHAAQWLLQGESTTDIGMPGLHFGEAGVALALWEMKKAGLIDMPHETCAPITHAAFAHASLWPDITHGMAGQGLAALHMLEGENGAEVARIAHDCAERLMASQKADGSWAMPDGVPGMSGETLSGFAHGVAGIGYFLVEYARRTGSKQAKAACLNAAEWLESAAHVQANGRLTWHYSDKNHAIWQWWCHGAMGISTFFRALWQLTGKNHYRALLEKSLYLPVEGFYAPNLTLCHGMSGLGLHLLEAFIATQNPRFLKDAEHIIEHLLSRAIRTQQGTGWIVEDPHHFSADLMVGMGGVLLLLFYYSEAMEKARFPGNLAMA